MQTFTLIFNALKRISHLGTSTKAKNTLLCLTAYVYNFILLLHFKTERDILYQNYQNWMGFSMLVLVADRFYQVYVLGWTFFRNLGATLKFYMPEWWQANSIPRTQKLLRATLQNLVARSSWRARLRSVHPCLLCTFLVQWTRKA